MKINHWTQQVHGSEEGESLQSSPPAEGIVRFYDSFLCRNFCLFPNSLSVQAVEIPCQICYNPWPEPWTWAGLHPGAFDRLTGARGE